MRMLCHLMLWPIALVLGGLAITLWAARLERRGVAAAGKVIASSAMVLLAALRMPSGNYDSYILAGLVACWCGDALLISRRKRFFVAGMAAFLIGHVAYAVAFMGFAGDMLRLVLGLVWVLLLATLILKWLWPHLPSVMHIPMIAYFTGIGWMVWMAAASGNNWILTGATLFFTSDLFVARHRFVAPGWNNRLIGLPLYYAGQVVLALTV